MTAPDLAELAPRWEARLRELVAQLDVPGAALGVSWRGERAVAVAGVAGLRNPQPVTVDTVFQLGSISKIYTATLLLAVAGPEILGRPIAELVPEARWMEREIRVVDLLTHSSGLGGDHFADTGRGDDALTRYVEELAQLPRDVPAVVVAAGRRYSYCNSGFSVVGRLIEVLTGDSYDAALRTHLLDPLGARATVTLPEDAILHPVALGHNRHDPAPLTADDRWSFSRACGPLGGIAATVTDLLAFAELHLRDGRTPGGATILEPDVTRLMRQRHLETPPLCRPAARGLGWGIHDGAGGDLLGHDGETLGQIASLRLAPAEELAVAVLTNAIPDGDEITSALVEMVLEPWGLRPATLTLEGERGAAREFDPTPYVGRYRNLDAVFDVAAAAGGLAVTDMTLAAGLESGTKVTQLVPLGDDAFVEAALARPTRAVRFGDRGDDGRCRSYFTGRLAWRVPAESE